MDSRDAARGNASYQVQQGVRGRFSSLWRIRCITALCILLPLTVFAQQPQAIERKCTSNVATTAALVDVPFEIVDGRIYVQAQVNDAGSHRFAVDTGASGVARADARLVRALDLAPADSASHSDGVQTAAAATVRINALRLGGLRREGIVAITRDYNARQSEAAAFDGILAREFFSDGLLELDFPHRRLRFRRDQLIDASTPGALSYSRAFRIPVRVGSVDVEAQLDTGANVTLVLSSAVYQRVSGEPLQAVGNLTLSHGEVAAGRTRLVGPLQVGGLQLRDVDVRVAERYPEVVVGAHALQQAVLRIDQRSQRVTLCVADPAER